MLPVPLIFLMYKSLYPSTGRSAAGCQTGSVDCCPGRVDFMPPRLPVCLPTCPMYPGSYFPPAVPAGAAVDVGSPSLAREQQPLLSPAAQGDMEQQQQWAAAPRQLPQPQPAVSPGADSGGFMSPFGSAGVRSGPTTPSQHAGADEAAAGMASDGLSKPQGWHDGAGQLTQQVASPASGRALAHHHQQQQQWQMHLAEQQQQPGAGGMPLAQVDGAGAGDSWQQLQWQVTLGNSEEWLEAGPVIKLFRKVREAGEQGQCIAPTAAAHKSCCRPLLAMSLVARIMACDSIQLPVCSGQGT